MPYDLPDDLGALIIRSENVLTPSNLPLGGGG